MKTRILFITAVILTLALGVCSVVVLTAPARWWAAGMSLLLLLTLGFLYQSIVMPATVAHRGLDMLRSQDFNVRLVKVGEPAADKVVDLFNSLILRLKNERLRLREQDTFLKQLIDASPMGIVMLDLDGRVTIFNPAMTKLASLPAIPDIIGREFNTIDSELLRSLAAISSGCSEIIRLDGSRLYRGYHLSFIQDGFRRQFYLLESLTEEVRRAEREAYDRVIRMIAHEVNNTMGSVQTVLEMLAEDYSSDPEMAETIDGCRERTGRMCEFIESFAGLARLPEPVTAQVDLAVEIQRMMPFLKLMVPEGASITFEHPEKPCIVQVDIALLQQAVVNIVKNAVESFSDAAGDHIELAINGRELCITNNGAPIDAAVVSRIFSPFFSTKRSGRGLGLMLISEVLRKHGCTFALRTDADGLTRFSIQFPDTGVI